MTRAQDSSAGRKIVDDSMVLGAKVTVNPANAGLRMGL
jgi:hypothetical protein